MKCFSSSPQQQLGFAFYSKAGRPSGHLSFEVTSVSKAEYFTSKTFLVLRPTRRTEEIFIGEEPLRRNMRELSTALPGAEDGSVTLVHVMSFH